MSTRDVTDSLRLQRNIDHYACLRHSNAARIEGVDDTEMYNIVTVIALAVVLKIPPLPSLRSVLVS